jgi:carboxypeptidase family protein
MIVLKKVAILILVLVAAAVPSLAQIERATLEGSLADPSGGSVSGAEITVTNVDTGITQKRDTDANGYYRFTGLAAGEYTVITTSPGFKTKTIEEVQLQVGQIHTLNLTLEVGATTERVEVVAQDLPSERSTAESSVVIGEVQIENLPMNGRNWAGLTRMAPWAEDDGGGDQRTIRFAGRARDDNNFSYDGVDATGIQEQAQKAEVRLQVSPDAIAEYRVISAMYDAEYGEQAGGEIDVVTKSGTNDFHGSAYGYFRNSAFDARNFTDFDVNGNPYLPPFRMGQYGGTLGGPIKKNKMFFFLNYEGLSQFGGYTLVAAVLDPTVQQAALSGPQSANLCPIIQAYPWRKSSVPLLSSYGCAPKFVYPDTAFAYNCPDPTNCLGTGYDNFTHQGDSIINENTWLARFDYNITPNILFYARAQRDIAYAASATGNLFDQVGTNNHPANYILALQTHTSATFTNEFKFGLNRAPFHNPVYPGLINISLSTPNYESLNNNQTDNEVGTTFSYVDNATWTRGRHTLKFGIDVMRVRLNQGKTQSLSVAFGGLPGDQTLTPPVAATPNDNTAFINNTLTSVDDTTSWDGHALRRTFVLPYVQDEWKATRDLTINAGLRWEYYSPVTEAHQRVKIFDLQTCHGVCPSNYSLEFPNYKNFDPRVSLAWAPSRFANKSVVRAGFGIYHGAAQNDDRNAALESDRTENKYVVGQAGAPATGIAFTPAFLHNPPDFGLPAGSAQPQLVARALIRHHPDLYVESWGLSVQQALPKNFIFTVSYLGSSGVHLFARNYENICDPAILHPGNSTIGPCVRPLDAYPVTNPDGTQSFWGTIDLKHNVGASSYNGILFALDRQVSKGLAFNAKYTFAHSINNASVGGGEASAPQYAACVSCEKGPSIYDVRHNIILSFVYELPFGPGQRYVTEGFAGKLLSGWTTSGLWNWHTGHPLTVTMNVSDPTLLPDGNDGSTPRPDVVPGVSFVPAGQNANNWVNTAAFTAPPYDPQTGALLRYGNAGNGLIRSPNVSQFDLSLQKQAHLRERLSVIFGAQVFNLFNHVQLADPHSLSFDYSCSSTNSDGVSPPFACSIAPHSNFGIINTTVNQNTNSDKFFADNTGTGLARQLQLFVRFEF